MTLNLPPTIHPLARAVADAGGRLYVVGGGVRDHHLGLRAKDIDLEVHGLEADEVRVILQRFGPAKEVGKSFGVFKLRADKQEIDVALPRTAARDTTAPKVIGDPHLGIQEATRRRDLTLNALLYDILDERIIDCHGGLEDMAAGLLRECAPDTFQEDPLRALRAVRFAAVLGYRLAPSLRNLCAEADLSEVFGERMRSELEKILLKAPRPGVALDLLKDIAQLDALFPGLSAASGPEHAAVLDRAAVHRAALRGIHERYALMAAALLHVGGPERAVGWMTGLRINRVRGAAIRQLVRSLLEVLPSVRPDLSDVDLRRLADRAPLKLLLPLADAVTPGNMALMPRARALGVADGPLPHLLTGGQLMGLGFKPGPMLGRTLAHLRAAQLEGRLTARADAEVEARRLLEAPAGEGL